MTAIEIMNKYCSPCQRKALCAVPCNTVKNKMAEEREIKK